MVYFLRESEALQAGNVHSMSGGVMEVGSQVSNHGRIRFSESNSGFEGPNFVFRATRFSQRFTAEGSATNSLNLDVEELRCQIRNLILGDSTLPEAVRYQANNLFFWRYMHLFDELAELRDWIQRNGLTHVAVDAPYCGPLGQTVFRGEEGRSILWEPRFEYPTFIKQLCDQIGVTVTFRSFRVVERIKYEIVKMRGGFFFCLKAWMLVLRFFKSRNLRKGALGRDGQNDRILFIARSRPHVEFFLNIFDHPLIKNHVNKLTVMLDPTLYDSKSPSFYEEKFPRASWLVQSGDFYSLKDIFEQALGVLGRLRLCKRSQLTLIVQGIQISDRAMLLYRELVLFSLDQALHRVVLDRAVRRLRASALISLESISPYIFLHDDVAREANIRSLRFQSCATTENEMVDLAATDGYYTDSEDLRENLCRVFPESHRRIHYIGNPLYRRVASKVEVRDSDSTTILYFTQPQEPGVQVEIIQTLFGWRNENLEGRIVLLKIHPRDDFDYSVFSGIKVLPRETSVIESLRGVDLAVSRGSGTLADALLLGVPYVACRFSDFDRTFTPFYLKDELKVNVYNRLELQRVLGDLESYRQSYFIHRNQYCDGRFRELSLEWLETAKDPSRDVRSVFQ